MRTYTVRVTRQEYDASLPWLMETRELAEKKTRRFDHLGGFLYQFTDKDTAYQFSAAVGVSTRYGIISE